MMGQVSLPRMTPIIKKLIIANIAIFVLAHLLPIILGEINGVIFNNFIRTFFHLNYQVADGNAFWIWQPFTYMFFHGNVMHLFFNMLVLYFLGIMVEQKMGSRLFLLFFIGCGAAAGLLDFVVKGIVFPELLSYQPVADGSARLPLTPGSDIYDGMASGKLVLDHTIGASGAIYAMLVAFVYFWPHQKLYVFFLIPVRAIILIGILIGIDLFGLIASSNENIAFLVHIFGALVGFGFVHYKYRQYNYLYMLKTKLNIAGPVSKYSGSSKNRTNQREQSSRTYDFKKRPGFPKPPFYSKQKKKDSEVYSFPDQVDHTDPKKIPTSLHHLSDQEIRDIMDSILDKIAKYGIDSITQEEKQFLDNVSEKYKS